MSAIFFRFVVVPALRQPRDVIVRGISSIFLALPASPMSWSDPFQRRHERRDLRALRVRAAGNVSNPA
jgi:hypothetical protein